MRNYLSVLAVLLTLALTWPAPAHDVPAQDEGSSQGDDTKRTSPGKDKDPHSPASAYKPDEILGWSLRVHEDLLADEALYQQVRDEIHHQLFRITQVVPEDKVALLKPVVIWVELKNPYSGACQYHPNKKWLLGNGYLGEKAKCVEISSARGFLNASRRTQPFVMLHELAHAYHDQQLSFDHPAIVQAFKAAQASGSYGKVLHMNGREVRAYAMTDHKEYFAEATEAYFGTNDHFPFVRPELKRHDPEMFAVVKEVWGLTK